MTENYFNYTFTYEQKRDSCHLASFLFLDIADNLEEKDVQKYDKIQSYWLHWFNPANQNTCKLEKELPWLPCLFLLLYCIRWIREVDWGNETIIIITIWGRVALCRIFIMSDNLHTCSIGRLLSPSQSRTGDSWDFRTLSSLFVSGWAISLDVFGIRAVLK